MASAQLAKFNQPAPTPAPPPRNAFDLDLPDEEYLNGAQVKQILARIAAQPTPVDWVGRGQSAQAVLGTVQIQRAEDFKRWPQEINAELSKLPQEHWSLDNLRTIVDIVKSRHIDELAAEKAERLVNEAHPTIRSGSGGSGGGPTIQPTLDGDDLPKEWVEKLRAEGIDETKVREFCEATGQTVAQYYADVVKWGKSGVIHG